MIKPLIGAIVAATVIALAVYAGIQYMGLHNEVEKAVEAEAQKVEAAAASSEVPDARFKEK
jgi:hypothetical protein